MGQLARFKQSIYLNLAFDIDSYIYKKNKIPWTNHP